MKMIKYFTAALLVSAPLSFAAMASDVESICLAKIAEEGDVPPEVTQDQINSFCTCLAGTVEADAELLSEFTEKLESAEEEEMGDAFKTAQKSCQEQALAG